MAAGAQWLSSTISPQIQTRISCSYPCLSLLLFCLPPISGFVSLISSDDGMRPTFPLYLFPFFSFDFGFIYLPFYNPILLAFSGISTIQVLTIF